MAVLNIEADLSEIKKFNKTLSKKAMPRATSRAINETLKWARGQAIKSVSSKLRLPQKFIKKRFTVDKQVKGDRTTLTLSTPRKLEGKLNVYMRGIPVFQIAGKQPKKRKEGVKAKGGRYYKGAFYSKRGLVFKPRAGGGRVMLPKVGVRKHLTKAFNGLLTSGNGVRQFQKRWNRLAQLEINKISK